MKIIISKLSKQELINYIGLTAVENSIIYPYTKAIAQAVVHEVPEMTIEEINYDALLTIPSKRGTGSLGSSGK